MFEPFLINHSALFHQISRKLTTMKFSGKLLKAAALAAAIISVPASAVADATSFKTGRYSFGKTSNLNSFTCASTGEEACKALFQMKSRLSKEEVDHLGSPRERAYMGDFVVAKEDGAPDLYSVTGGIFIGRAGEYSFRSKNSDRALCRLTRPEVLVCAVYDRDPNIDEVNESTATLTFRKNDKVDLQVEILGDPENISPNFEELVRYVDGQTFRFETEEEYRHDMFVSARLRYLMVDADLNRKWKSLDKKTRDKLLPEQREWISKKEKKCGSVTMKGSESELAAMYACQKEMTEDRLYKELASY